LEPSGEAALWAGRAGWSKISSFTSTQAEADGGFSLLRIVHGAPLNDRIDPREEPLERERNRELLNSIAP